MAQVQAPRERSAVLSIANRLSTKVLAGLIVLGLFLLSGILTIAVFRGASVHLWIIDIGARPVQERPAAAPLPLRLNVDFQPQVNVRSPDFVAHAFVKAIDGRELGLPFRSGTEQGALWIETQLPDTTTPIFFEFRSKNRVWKTEEYRMSSNRVSAFEIGGGQ